MLVGVEYGGNHPKTIGEARSVNTHRGTQITFRARGANGGEGLDFGSDTEVGAIVMR